MSGQEPQQRARPPGRDGSTAARVARVVINLSLDRAFDYDIPPHLRGRVHIGSCVHVPFGKGNSQRRGYVVATCADSDVPRRKPIAAVEGDRELIPPRLVDLAEWIARYYCCPREQAVRAVLPAVVRGGKMRRKTEKVVCLTDKARRDDPSDLTTKQQAMLETARRLGPCRIQHLQRESGAGSSVLKRLRTHDWLMLDDRVVGRDPFEGDEILRSTALTLTDPQQRALDLVLEAVEGRAGGVVLLHGVTGSGKTEVYLQAIQHCLDDGLEAIVLVPEIALTPQTTERFRGRFGDRVSVLHSGLSDGQRFDEWTRVHEGRASIVVGARSALFAPFRNLGLIVVDEEHEGTYKQEEAPRYNARDVAVLRGRMEGAAVVLGSATPSLESYRNSRIGKYRLAELRERVDDCRMPTMEVIDMRAEAAMRGSPQIFSRRLESSVLERLDRGEQTILFLNRRGYATQFLCTQCGFVAQCEHCSTSFTYHRREQTLCCHLCGHLEKAPATCPQCRDENVRYAGLGTEKVEAAAHALFGKATIGRMDSDTMTTAKSYRKALHAFRTGRTHILIGTQMIAKGLHFPNVTLVGIIFADLGLHMPDFRASERTFQLLTQVSGRAGRGDVAGHVMVQTYTPFHSALTHAVEHNFHGFFEEEFEARDILGFPPSKHLTLIHVRAKAAAVAEEVVEAIGSVLQKGLPDSVIVAPPAPAPIARIRGYYRYQVLLRGGNPMRLSPYLKRVIAPYARRRDVCVHVDVDARSLM